MAKSGQVLSSKICYCNSTTFPFQMSALEMKNSFQENSPINIYYGNQIPMSCLHKADT